MAKHEAVFTKDTTNRKITVVRTFEASLADVWDAWTQSELLDKWWAPEPYKAITKEMSFSEGGHWLYSMNGPEGDSQFCKFNYDKIEPKDYYTGSDMFCDENGNPTNEFPSMDWKVQFAGDGTATMVTIEINFAKDEDMQTILQMGFEEGFAMGLGNLDRLLEGK